MIEQLKRDPTHIDQSQLEQLGRLARRSYHLAEEFVQLARAEQDEGHICFIGSRAAALHEILTPITRQTSNSPLHQADSELGTFLITNFGERILQKSRF